MATTPKAKRMALSLRQKVEAISFLNRLTTGKAISLDDADSVPWFEAGRIYQISRTTYMYHFESDSVRWSEGRKFVFTFDQNPFQLFWSTDDEFFGRQLTEEETFRFCQLMDVKRFVA